MTDQELNRIVHEARGMNAHVGLMKQGMWYRHKACGYTSSEYEAGKFSREEAKKHEYKPSGHEQEWVTIHEFTPPDYGHDLNVMREALLSLAPGLRLKWCEILVEQVLVEGMTFDQKESISAEECVWMTLTATAAQQRETYIRLLGKWRDD